MGNAMRLIEEGTRHFRVGGGQERGTRVLPAVPACPGLHPEN
jgi:hypothetical protein